MADNDVTATSAAVTNDHASSHSGKEGSLGKHEQHQVDHHDGAHEHKAITTIAPWKAYTVLFGTTLSYVAYIGVLQAMNVALPFVAMDLKFTLSNTQWIQSAYTLSAACLTLLFVAISTTFGAKRVWAFGTIFYIIWTAALAGAQSDVQFIAFRALEGVGSAAILPAGFGVIGQIFPERRGSKMRTLAMAIFSSGAPIGSGIGTIVGGVPTEYAHTLKWRVTFIVFAIMGLVSLVALPLIPTSPREKLKGGVDYAGAAIITVGLTLFLFVLSQSTDVGWDTGYIIALLIVGLLFIFGFVAYEIWVERQDKTPMMRMSNFGRDRFAVAMLIAFVGWGSFSGWDFWAAQYYGRFAGYSPIEIMKRFLPQSIFAFVSAFIANYLLMRVPGQWVFILGTISSSAASLIFTFAKPDILYWKLEFWAFILGINGACFMYAAATVYAVQVVSYNEAPMAGSLTTTLNNMSTSFVLCVSSIVATNHADPARPRRTFQYGQWTCFGMGIAGVVLAVTGLWGIGIIADVGQERRLMEQDARDAEEGRHHQSNDHSTIVSDEKPHHDVLATEAAPVAAA